MQGAKAKKRQAAQRDPPNRSLTEEEKRIGMVMVEARPPKLDRHSGKPCPDFAGAAAALLPSPYNWLLPYETLLVSLRSVYDVKKGLDKERHR